jgi:ABC-2 type transport system ATP-binding protein
MGVETTSGAAALTLRGLRKSYGDRRALDGLDLTVPTGVVYGFLGPNGAGKTTTMRILTGLVRSDGGSIEMLGSKFDRRQRRILFSVGALIETPSFYPYLSARGNLSALAASGPRVPAKRIDEMLELVGLTERAREPVSRFSLGMKQRLGIAAALLNDPELLLLDEPANGLDPAGIVAMRELLRHLASSGKTVFVSSHLLAEVTQMADLVGIIAAGRLVREGTIDDLLREMGSLRIRVGAAEAGRAGEVLANFGAVSNQPADRADDRWLELQVAPARSSEVNRTLAEAGIFAAELRVGTGLEDLFLSLTQGAASADGNFGPIATSGQGSGGSGGPA